MRLLHTLPVAALAALGFAVPAVAAPTDAGQVDCEVVAWIEMTSPANLQSTFSSTSSLIMAPRRSR